MALLASAQPVIDCGHVEDQILMLSNRERMQWNACAVRRHVGLDAVAAFHCHDMVRRGFFAHVNPDGLGPQERVQMVSPQLVAGAAENLAMMSLLGEDACASATVCGWMNSKGHRENLLDYTHTHMGLSVVSSGRSFYATQVLATICLEVHERTFPLRVKMGELRRIGFRFYGKFPTNDLSLMLELPNKDQWVPIRNEGMVKGSVPLRPHWNSPLEAHVDFTALAGNGVYKLFAGQSSRRLYYPAPLAIQVTV